MIFDCHLHVRVAGMQNAEKEIQTLLEDMKLVGIDKTCLMPDPLGSLYFSREDTVKMAELFNDLGARYKGILYPMIWLNPTLPADFLIDIMERYIVRGNIIGVKLWVEMNARDPRLEPICAYMQEHDIPILYHTWYKTVQKYAAESDTSDVAVLAAKFPKLRIIAAHLTGFKERGVQDVKPYANLVIDTSGCQPEDGLMEYAVKELGADRVLFGSDYAGRDFATQLARINSFKVSEEDKEKILYKNALKFFRRGE